MCITSGKKNCPLIVYEVFSLHRFSLTRIVKDSNYVHNTFDTPRTCGLKSTSDKGTKLRRRLLYFKIK